MDQASRGLMEVKNTLFFCSVSRVRLESRKNCRERLAETENALPFCSSRSVYCHRIWNRLLLICSGSDWNAGLLRNDFSCLFILEKWLFNWVRQMSDRSVDRNILMPLEFDWELKKLPASFWLVKRRKHSRESLVWPVIILLYR